MSNTQRSVLGKVPCGWTVAELQDLGSWGGGKTPRKSNQEYWNGQTPWVSPKDMGGSVVRRTEDHVSRVALSEKNLMVYAPGSVMVVFRSGVLRHTFPVATCNRPFTVNQDMKVLTPGGGVDNRFAFHLIDHLGPVVLQKATKVGTTVESVDTDSFMSLSVGLPPLSEQRRIADMLDTVDAAIQETDSVVGKQEQVKTGLLQDLLTRGLDADGWLRDPEREPEAFRETELGVLPAHWEIKQLKDIGRLVTGNTPSSGEEGAWGESIPFVTPGDITEEGDIERPERWLSPHGADLVRPVPAGSILVVCIGATIGKSALVDRRVATNQQINSVVPHQENDNRYLYAAIRSCVDQLRRVAGLQAVPIVNKTRFGETLIPIAPPSEQRRIGKLIEYQNRLRQREITYRKKLRDLKTGLMQDLLTGRVRVPEAEARVDEVVA